MTSCANSDDDAKDLIVPIMITIVRMKIVIKMRLVMMMTAVVVMIRRMTKPISTKR